MTHLQAVFYRAPDGAQPVDEFIESLPVKVQVVLDDQIDRLNDLTDAVPHLPFPNSSQVDGSLRELRCHYGRALYRVLYCRSANLSVLLHAFRKNTRAVPAADIRIALERRADFQAGDAPTAGSRHSRCAS